MQTGKSKVKYRGVLGGLDNAVKQAEMRGFQNMMIVDSDCHYSQPLEEFTTYLKKYTKKSWELPEDKQTVEYLQKAQTMGYGIETQDKEELQTDYFRRIKRPEFAMGGKETPDRILDRFTSRMYDVGIKRSVLFPAALVYSLGMVKDHELEVGISNAYVDFMLDHFLGKYKEILTVIPAPANSPDRAAELIDRTGSEKGIVGVLISPIRTPPLGEDFYNPIYKAAQKKGLPILVHSGFYWGDPFADFTRNLEVYTLQFPFFLMKQLTSVLVQGVPVRFPNLKWFWVEGGIAWIPFMMHRLNTMYEEKRDDAPLLKKMPSEYMKEFYYSSQPLEQSAGHRNLQWMFEQFDAENHLLYASDFPHVDFDVPSAVYDLPFLSKEAKAKIMGGNAVKLFKID
jgi:uncharacterized protein